MVPNGWSHTTLGKVMAFKNGLNFTKADVGEEIKIVGVSDFKDLSELRSTERLESVNVASRIKDDELLTDGDLLFVRSNGNKDLIGRCLFFPKVKERLSFSGFTIRGRADKKNILPQYIAFVARSSFFKSQISQYGGGTNISNLSQQILNDIALPLPPHDEQKKIVQILATWEKAISTTEQLLANNQQHKKALMQQLLTGKKRLNGYSGAFKRYHFSDILKIDSKSLGTKTDPDFEFDYISLSDVELGKIGSVLEHHVYKNAPSRARRIVKAGDILLSTVRPNLQGFAKISNPHENCIASTGFSVLTPKKGTCGDYIYHYLFSAHITGQINSLVVGTNYPAINSSDVSGLCIYCPCYDEQVKIAAILNNSDATIIALQQKLDALKQEKKALMQQLLTGKRRVKIN